MTSKKEIIFQDSKGDWRFWREDWLNTSRAYPTKKECVQALLDYTYKKFPHTRQRELPGV